MCDLTIKLSTKPLALTGWRITLHEAIAESNRLPYGLAGYAFTRSLQAAHQFAQRLELGMLWNRTFLAP
jgi:succinate-semialdehyde dehydrogenase/glutarate-semialdehyde dehydrogenase